MMRLLAIIALTGLLTACRSTKKIQTAIAKKDTSSVVMVAPNPKTDSLQYLHSILTAMAGNHIDFKTFSAKINVDYRDASSKSYDVNAFVRMYKDSVIWVSVNAIFGIEAMRVLITKDSVKLLDKPNKILTVRSISYLQEVTALPLDLPTLQDLIVGNPVFLDSNIVSYTKNGNNISLLSIGKFFKNLITLNGQDKTLQHSKLDDVNISRNRTADLTYSDYQNKGGRLFSTERNITVAEKNKLDIKLDVKQYDFNEEVSFPFSIPKNSKKK